MSESERNLLRAASTGEEAICGPASDLNAPENDPAKAQSWGPDRAIRAALLKWLCLERAAREHIQPFGIRAIGARMDGRFDLSFATIPFPLFFRACWWPAGIALENASLPELSLTKCRIFPPSDPVGGGASPSHAIGARGAHVRGSLFLDQGFRVEGQVHLLQADVGGTLNCEGGSFKNAKGTALNGQGAKIGGPVLLRNGFESEGEVRLFGAEIGGIACDGGRFRNTQGTALNAEGAK
ncbi:MAG TPA: hypothetical protein VJY34_07480, partial [Roseiarcus sp.]|nr:hypothetical protein [Roseiarcus sp.]